MEVKAILKFARMSPTKARDLIKMIRGLPVSDALRAVQFSHRKGALLIEKTLKSAIANAENNAKLSAESLFVKEALVLDGPSMKRYWPRSRGSASPILKRMCHVRIVLSDERPGGKKARVRKETEASGTEG